MDLYAVIKAEDAKILRTLGKLEDATAGRSAERESLVHQVQARVEARRQLKEERLHPLLAVDPRTEGDVRESRDRDVETAELLDELARTPPGEAGFQRRAEAVSGTIRAHLEWEEHELLARAPAAIPEQQAEELGERAEQELAELERELERRFA